MSNLPFTLPTCDEPATVRIEVYSAANGTLYGSLDGAVYTCDEHGIEVVSAVQAAGLTAYRVPGAPDVDRTCGESYVYPTGALAAGDQHPRWCDRQDCERRGEHRSAVMGVKPSPHDLTATTVQLVQLIAVTATPVLIEFAFIADDPGGSTTQLVTLDQAVALTYRIRGLADRAKGRRR
ncbi:hypothetical protein U2F26_03250 [Micromonospora sp. 4G57]|uniref:Uncharacterized protein n=1 Tax=Micromonospora sicca TaxID=2202420 RepID=A0ABU5JD17_9ACTN|nr:MULTISPECIES: hypothetical protein [unclassified Micromonospora]MDZ5441748.1 hypothetical protein [Micromonospora sp. 4G57]MDZ5490309.1 hypothetical protein [Micromonospora sp. 4G53]